MQVRFVWLLSDNSPKFRRIRPGSETGVGVRMETVAKGSTGFDKLDF
jgi:hypothetical protein